MEEALHQSPKTRRSGWRRARRWLLRGGVVLAAPALIYFGAAEVGMRISVNADVAPLDGSIDVYLVSNGPHVDVWVPAIRPEFRWDAHLPEGFHLEHRGYLAFGWGDEAFYTQVPEWSDLTAGVALRGALYPTPAVMRVTSWWGIPKLSERIHLLRLTPEGYGDLCQFILESFARSEEGSLLPIDHPGYRDAWEDRFFRARGSYHMFRTCNSWSNDALEVAGKRAALWSPLARGVVRQLPKNGGLPSGD